MKNFFLKYFLLITVASSTLILGCNRPPEIRGKWKFDSEKTFKLAENSALKLYEDKVISKEMIATHIDITMKFGNLLETIEINENHKFLFLDYECKVNTLDETKGVECTKPANKENTFEFIEMGLIYDSEKLHLRIKPSFAPIIFSK